MLAILLAEELQATVELMSCDVPSLYFPVAVNCCVDPKAMVDPDGVTAIDVKVALVGQGPDELFGGYVRHLGVRYGALWARLPGWMRTPISSAIAALPRNETLKRGVYSLAIPDRMRRY